MTETNTDTNQREKELGSGSESFHLNFVADRRDNPLGFEGRVAVADALDRITSLTSLNGCDQYSAIRKGGLAELTLYAESELAVAVARYLPRSGSTLTRLDLRCAKLRSHRLIMCSRVLSTSRGVFVLALASEWRQRRNSSVV